MKIWLVTIKSGGKTTTLYVQAATKDEAQTKAIGASPSGAEAYVQGTVAKVPEGYTLVTGAGPTPTTTPTPTSTPTTTTGTATGATTGGITTSPGGWSVPSNAAALGQQYGEAYNEYYKEWQAYQEYQAAHPELNLPYAANIDEYAKIAYQMTGKTFTERQGTQGEQPPAVTPDEESQWSNDQIRQYNDYRQWYSQYGEPGDWMPANIEDFFANQDAANQQMTIFQQRQTEQGQKQAEQEAYTAEQRARAEYAQKEAYGEAPMYQETFAKWIGGQGDVSEALRGFIEQQYPSLRAEYEAGLPRLTGYPTREEARAEAARRETGFSGWLEERQPETYQEYMMQRPYARGERYAEYSPSLRGVNW